MNSDSEPLVGEVSIEEEMDYAGQSKSANKICLFQSVIFLAIGILLSAILLIFAFSPTFAFATYIFDPIIVITPLILSIYFGIRVYSFSKGNQPQGKTLLPSLQYGFNIFAIILWIIALIPVIVFLILAETRECAECEQYPEEDCFCGFTEALFALMFFWISVIACIPAFGMVPFSAAMHVMAQLKKKASPEAYRQI